MGFWRENYWDLVLDVGKYKNSLSGKLTIISEQTLKRNSRKNEKI
jgi:hypothetical protein